MPQRMRTGNLEIELYDLDSDPGEKKNVAAKHADVVARAGELFSSEHRPSKIFPLQSLGKR